MMEHCQSIEGKFMSSVSLKSTLEHMIWSVDIVFYVLTYKQDRNNFCEKNFTTLVGIKIRRLRVTFKCHLQRHVSGSDVHLMLNHKIQ